MNRYLIPLVVFLTGCDPAPLEPTHDVVGIPQTITVYTYSSKKALNKAVAGLEHAPDYEVEGLAQWRIDAIGNVKRCDIYVEEPSERLDHGAMETWGHELMHCIYGEYHAEGQR